MIRIRKGLLVLSLFLLAILGGFASASGNDYKNNLLKVDLVRTGENQYRIDLFTQKPYSVPVKVNKKTDTSYYILLPETYHSITSALACDDVRSVDVKLYPYEGQDLNNGYTKINITTSKPLMIAADVKTANAGSAPKVDFEKLAQLDAIFAQQNPQANKTTDAQKSSGVQNVSPTEVIQQQAAKADNAQKAGALNEVPNALRNASKSPQKTVVIDIDSDDVVVMPQKQVTIDMGKIPHGRNLPELDTIPDEMTPVDLDNVTGSIADASQAAVNEAADNTADVTVGATEEGGGEIFSNEEVYPIDDLSTIGRVKSKLRAIYNIALENLTAILGICGILLLLFIISLSKKRKKKAQAQEQTQVGIQSQSDVMKDDPLQAMKDAAKQRQEEEERVYVPPGQQTGGEFAGSGSAEDESLTPHPSYSNVQEEAQEQDVYAQTAVQEPQYIRETGFEQATQQIFAQQEPSHTPQESYIQEAYIHEAYTHGGQTYVHDEYVAQAHLDPVSDYTPYIEPVETHLPYVEPLGLEDEATILSYAEIEPGRGLYLARFEGTVSLVGFVGSSLFVIHSFKREPNDTNIAFRLSERSSEGNFYLVRVDDVKMLVRSSQNALSLELLM